MVYCLPLSVKCISHGGMKLREKNYKNRPDQDAQQFLLRGIIMLATDGQVYSLQGEQERERER